MAWSMNEVKQKLIECTSCADLDESKIFVFSDSNILICNCDL